MSQTPETSIVILTKNAGPQFRATLAQIHNQQAEHAFEVVVVDSGSADQTLEFIKDFPVRLFTIPAGEFNFGLTRDYAVSLTSGEYIATLSQDAVPLDTHWLQNLIRPFLSNPNVIAVQGAEQPPEGQPGFYWQRCGHFNFTSESRRWMEKYKVGLSFVNCAVRKAFWAKHPIGFTPSSSDKRFQTRIQAAGGEIVVARDAICVHGHTYTFRSLVRTLRQQGTGWKYAGMEYSFRDCMLDIVGNRWMLRRTWGALRRREIRSWHEFLFPLLRPACVYWGNHAEMRSSQKQTGRV